MKPELSYRESSILKEQAEANNPRRFVEVWEQVTGEELSYPEAIKKMKFFTASYYKEYLNGVHVRDVTPREFWCLPDHVASQFEYVEAHGFPKKCLTRSVVDGRVLAPIMGSLSDDLGDKT